MSPRVRMHGALAGAVIALTFALTWSLLKVPELESKADSAATEVSTLKPQVEALTENQGKLVSGLDEANRRLVALGKSPVPVPTVTPAPLPVQPDEFTADEAEAVRQIVSQQLSQQKVSITQAEISQIARTAAALIPKPADGKTPTAAEMQRYAQISVAAYCAGDRCRAPVVTPSPGPRGPQGEKGDSAPKITDEELLASAKLALAAYCAQDDKPCDGKPGSDGKDAPPPWSVTDMDCLGDDAESYWRIYLSNGTDQKTINEKGPCRVGPEPE